MACTPLLLTLVALCSGTWAQSRLTQEASLSQSVGETAKLSCSGSSNNVGYYNVGWYQQVPGAAPKTVMIGSSRPSGIPDRFSGSKSGNTAFLSISNLQAEGEADYFCSSWDSSQKGYPVLRPHGDLRQKLPLTSREANPPVTICDNPSFFSQPVVTQPPSLSVSPGASARLTCTLSSGFSVGDFTIRWYQHKPGSPPRFLLLYGSSTQLGSGVPSRFSGSKDTSANAGVLNVSGPQPEDEADYYCSIWHGSSKMYTVMCTHREVTLKPLLHSLR
ncbi:Ig lambda chain V-I region BL2 [Fukomys damarensis]|uniref:Ig lambda chain V-I region BL2 n=1 Tax=Fukomys damarensis TaxID=885580 RepID=A0A091CY81_FUKDA|nr:Ig lambda chain V-I region BL2 [Fukomys damarensis]